MCQAMQNIEHETRNVAKMYVQFWYRDTGAEKPKYLSIIRGEVDQHQWLYIYRNTIPILKPVVGRLRMILLICE